MKREIAKREKTKTHNKANNSDAQYSCPPTTEQCPANPNHRSVGPGQLPPVSILSIMFYGMEYPFG